MLDISSNQTIFWFRRDLRLEDNTGLFHALKESGDVQPIFIFDRNILDELPPDDKRVSFIHGALTELDHQLSLQNSRLLTFYSDPLEVFKELNPKAVYTNHDYEPYATERDEKIRLELEGRGIHFKTFKDQVVFEKKEITKDDGSPYVVYTPYSRKWLSKYQQQGVQKRQGGGGVRGGRRLSDGASQQLQRASASTINRQYHRVHSCSQRMDTRFIQTHDQ